MEQLRISCIQADLAWENREANLKKFGDILASLQGKTDLAVLPEMFTTGFSMAPRGLFEDPQGPSVRWMQEQAEKLGMAITGSVIVGENGSFYNRLLWAEPGKEMRSYNKRHLFRLAGEEKEYRGGTERLRISFKGFTICPMICYDLRFPVWSRRTAHFDYDLLLYVANWPQRRNHPWKTLLRARAIENQCFVAGVNRVGNDANSIFHSGDSAVIDFKGEDLAVAGEGKEEVLNVSLDRAALLDFRKSFPFHMDADNFLLT